LRVLLIPFISVTFTQFNIPFKGTVSITRNHLPHTDFSLHWLVSQHFNNTCSESFSLTHRRYLPSSNLLLIPLSFQIPLSSHIVPHSVTLITVYTTYCSTHNSGLAMDRDISRRPFMARDWVESQINSCGVCGTQRGNDTSLSPNISFFVVSITSSVFRKLSYICHRSDTILANDRFFKKHTFNEESMPRNIYKI